MENRERFWQHIEQLVAEAEVVIDRPAIAYSRVAKDFEAVAGFVREVLA